MQSSSITFVYCDCVTTCINPIHLCCRVDHAASWKVIKPHIQEIIVEVLFPLLCHSDEDQELWESDPIEYIRTKYGSNVLLSCDRVVNYIGFVFRLDSICKA